LSAKPPWRRRAITRPTMPRERIRAKFDEEKLFVLEDVKKGLDHLHA